MSNDFLPAEGVPKSPFTGVPGWDTIDEERRLMDIASKVKPHGTIVELGVEYGRGTAAMATAAGPDVKIYSIDLFPTDHPLVGDLLEAHKHNLTVAGFAGRTIIFKVDSKQAGEAWRFGKVDFLFIDAEHSYRGALGDLRSWEKNIALGGIIACHDCAVGDAPHATHIEVNRAVNDWYDPKQWDELDRTDSMRVFVRVA